LRLGTEILERLVALNADRADGEAQGNIRWRRPAFQCLESVEVQAEFPSTETRSRIGSTTVAPGQDRGTAGRKPAWPKTLPKQVRVALAAASGPVTADYKIGMLRKFQ